MQVLMVTDEAHAVLSDTAKCHKSALSNVILLLSKILRR
jgi:hypothetical protein